MADRTDDLHLGSLWPADGRRPAGSAAQRPHEDVEQPVELAAGSSVMPVWTGPGWTTVLLGAVSQRNRRPGSSRPAGPAAGAPAQTSTTARRAARTASTSAPGSRACSRRSSSATRAPRNPRARQ